jgi:hypothetical protein
MSRERRIIAYAEGRKLRYRLTCEHAVWTAEIGDKRNGAPLFVGRGPSKRLALKRLLRMIGDDWREQIDPYP